MYGTKEAILAKQRLGEEVSCSVFFMDERAFNKEYSEYFNKARKEHGIQYQRTRVSAIHEDPATQDLLIQYADQNGKIHFERFDMVVLAIGLQPPDTARHFTEMLDLELNEYGFCRTEKFTPLSTTHSGVFVCGAFSTPKEISETIIDASGAAAEVMRLLNERFEYTPLYASTPSSRTRYYHPNVM
jgi:heterodisulfide reductase subunit A